MLALWVEKSSWPFAGRTRIDLIRVSVVPTRLRLTVQAGEDIRPGGEGEA